jgi:hypothetical protein
MLQVTVATAQARIIMQQGTVYCGNIPHLLGDIRMAGSAAIGHSL